MRETWCVERSAWGHDFYTHVILSVSEGSPTSRCALMTKCSFLQSGEILRSQARSE